MFMMTFEETLKPTYTMEVVLASVEALMTGTPTSTTTTTSTIPLSILPSPLTWIGMLAALIPLDLA